MRQATTSRRKEIKILTKETDAKVKALVLEELASLTPFPQMKIGVAVKDEPESFDGTETVEGILVRDSLNPPKCLLEFAEAIVLKQDGAYWYRGMCYPKSKPYMTDIVFSNFLVRADPFSKRKFYDGEYTQHQGMIFDAIESARGRTKNS